MYVCVSVSWQAEGGNHGGQNPVGPGAGHNHRGQKGGGMGWAGRGGEGGLYRYMMFILVLYLTVEDNRGLSVWLYEKNLNSNTKTFVEENLREKLPRKKNIHKKVVIFNLGECICPCCVNINMPIYKIISTQLNNCALHISCYTTNVGHRFIQLHLLWFCLGAHIVLTHRFPG